ncbi:MAG: deoxyribonuclease IV [Gaiellaceae bacterium]
MLFGAHCSGGVKGALDRAEGFGADVVQLFAQSPRAWRFPQHDPADLKRFRERLAAGPVRRALVHALYLVNLATTNEEIYEKSASTLSSTVQTASAIDADGVIFHVGSHLGAGFEAGLERVAAAIARALERCSDRTWLLMENSAGAGGTIGRSVDELTAIFDRLDHHPRLGVCLDSCHLFVSGCDVTAPGALASVLADLDSGIGLARLRALHVNDTQAPLGSNRDRHANVGEGLMGERLGAFLAHPAVQELPAVLEVPGKEGRGPDADEVRKLRELHARWAPGPEFASK